MKNKKIRYTVKLDVEAGKLTHLKPKIKTKEVSTNKDTNCET